MTGSWVLRWDSLQKDRPQLLFLDGDESQHPSVFQADSGSFVVVDGYLFDRTSLENGEAASDAALVAAAYQRWGEDLWDRLRGGYMIAIWDPERNCLLVSRDATGLNPCFYWWNDPVFICSSSLDAVLVQPEVSGNVNRVVIAEYLTNFYPDHQREETFYEEVRRLPAAHTVSVSRGGRALSRYWDPVPLGFTWASDEELSQFSPLLERAVRRCLSIGADSLALSGGFDSVSIAILAARQLRGKPPLHAVSLLFTDGRCNEAETQTAVARSLGMPQVLRTLEESLDGDTFVGGSLALSRTSPSPVLSQWQSVYTGLLKSASSLNLQRLLMGTGGDDIFNVDFSYGADCLAALDLRGLWRFYRSWQRTSPFSALLVARAVIWEGAVKSEIRKRAASTLHRLSPRTVSWLRRRRSLPAWVSRADGDLTAALECRRSEQRPIELAPGERSYVRVIRSLTQAPPLLLELDQALIWGRSHGFRLLYPYFDRDLMELVLRMHPDHLISGGRAKAPLRRMVAECLPEVTMPAKKVDFTQMAHDVLRSGGRTAWRELGGPKRLAELGIVDPDRLNPLMEDYFEGRNDRWTLLWRVLSAEIWLRARSGERYGQ